MVDSISSTGAVPPVAQQRNDQVTDRREKKAEEDKQVAAREQDRVEISSQALDQAQAEDAAKVARQQLQQSNESLSGGRIVDQSV